MSGSKDEGALLGNVKPSPQPPGRGVLVHRRAAPVQAQVAWTPPAH
jgi:S-DNA-T family DNA segregation ATPase FtsK/SpoIIIE